MKKLLLIILICLFTSTSYAATYYVKSGGNDEAAGTSDELAWATIAKVNATVTSGDTVYFRSQDTWTGTLPVLVAKAGVTYDGSTYGAGTRATLQCTTGGIDYNKYAVVHVFASSVTLRGLDIDGNELDVGGIYIGYNIEANISGITVDNCIVHDLGAVDSSWLYGIHVGSAAHSTTGYTVSDVTITNTTVYNAFHEGIAIYPGWQDEEATSWNRNNNILVRGCTVYNAGYRDTSASDTVGHGIIVVNDSDNVTLEFNKIYNCSSTGIWVRTSPTSDGYINSGPDNLIIRYNQIYNNWSIGLFFYNQQGKPITADIYGNIIFNTGRAWAYSYGYDFCIGGAYSYADSTISFYNNTIFNTLNECTDKQGVSINASITGSPAFNFKNNIIYTNTFRGIVDEGELLTHSNNLIYRSSGATDAHVLSGEITYDRDGTASDITNWEATAQKTDPAFSGGTLPTGFSGTYGSNMVPNTDYFQLTVDSPAKDTGATLASYTGSINGAGLTTPIVRPLGAAFDIGAYEYGTVAQSGGSAGQGFKLQGVTIR
jgi:hypothetical protein